MEVGLRPFFSRIRNMPLNEKGGERPMTFEGVIKRFELFLFGYYHGLSKEKMCRPIEVIVNEAWDQYRKSMNNIEKFEENEAPE